MEISPASSESGPTSTQSRPAPAGKSFRGRPRRRLSEAKPDSSTYPSRIAAQPPTKGQKRPARAVWRWGGRVRWIGVADVLAIQPRHGRAWWVKGMQEWPWGHATYKLAGSVSRSGVEVKKSLHGSFLQLVQKRVFRGKTHQSSGCIGVPIGG